MANSNSNDGSYSNDGSFRNDRSDSPSKAESHFLKDMVVAEGNSPKHHPPSERSLESANLLIDKTKKSLVSFGVPRFAKLLLAVSGGPDSMALLHALVQLRDLGNTGELTIAHINHRLRPASDSEERMVRRIAAQWNVPIEVKTVWTKDYALERGKGVEETARDIRYRFFREVALRKSIKYVLTAHTANDQAESVIMNLVRGAGIRGLAGIPVSRVGGGGRILRPWLAIMREEIEDYIKANHIPVVRDKSNNDLRYQRNRVRHIVIPALEEAYEGRSPVQSINAMARRMHELDKVLRGIFREKFKALLRSDNTLDLEGISSFRGLALNSVIEMWMHRLGIHYRLSDRETGAIANFLKTDRPRIQLKSGVILAKDRDVLTIERGDFVEFESRTIEPGEEVTVPAGTVSVFSEPAGEIEKDLDIAYFDAGHPALRKGLMIRPWQAGDHITPFGMRGKTKLVSDLLNEAGVRGKRKFQWPLVVSRTDNSVVLWIPGVRASECARVTEETETMLRIEFIPKI
jgi:tRNA(Ile)-lysidine synthase